MTGPAPGRIPRKNPMTVPRAMGPKESFQSCELGKRFLILVSKDFLADPFLDIEEDLGDPEEAHDHRERSRARP